MTQPEIAIVGAGAAGIGAAMECADRGISCILLEAADRIGGRAHTDSHSLPAPWDKGCHWLHCADENPLVPWADRLGAVYDTSGDDENFVGWSHGAFLTTSEANECHSTVEAAFDAIYDAGEAGRDVAIPTVLPDAGRWAPHVRCILQLLIGDDPEADSAAAYAYYDDTEADWPVRSGLGALVAAMAHGLDIRLNTPVTKITQTTSGARLETPTGTLTADAAIVTASTSVLASGAIQFGAGPASDLLGTMSHLSCGAFEKVAFALPRLPDELKGKDYLLIETGNSDPVVEFQIVHGVHPMLICNIAGSPARDLAALPDPARVDFARSRLETVFGSDLTRTITHAATTDWLNDPLIRGSYSRTDPGFAQHRLDMIAADTGRVAFAGEAFSLDWQATAHGAWQSGRDVAARMARHVTGGAKNTS